MSKQCRPKRRRPLSAATRGLLAGTAVGAVLGLAACGSAVAGGTAHSGSTTSGKKASAMQPNTIQPGGTMIPAGSGTKFSICTHVNSLVRVMVVRQSGMVKLGRMPQVTPIMLKDPARVRQLASQLCGLPPQEASVMNCPANFGTAYRFAFASTTQTFQLVTVQTSGCRTVSGLGQARSWARSPRLSQVIRQTVDSGSALLPTHQGSVPTP
jgi:hypothetical protein